MNSQHQSMKRRAFSSPAFTLVEIMIVVAIIGLLAVIAIPNFVRARQNAQTNTCINNLRIIDGAKQQWALELRQVGGAVPTFNDLGPYLVRGSGARLPLCPANAGDTNFNNNYSINAVTSSPTCVINPTDHVMPL